MIPTMFSIRMSDAKRWLICGLASPFLVTAADDLLLLQMKFETRAKEQRLTSSEELARTLKPPKFDSYREILIIGVLALLARAISVLFLPLFLRWMGEGALSFSDKQLGAASASLNDGSVGATRHEPSSSKMCGEELPVDFVGGSVTALFETHAKQNFERKAVVDALTSNELTYKELDDKVSAMAHLLTGIGLGGEAAVVLLLRPSVQMVVATLACMRQGFTWVPMDAEAPAARLKLQLQIVNAQLVLVLERTTAVDELESLVPIGTISASSALQLSPTLTARTAALAETPCPTMPVGTAVVFFTSGSTGMPKAVMYGHETVLHGVYSFVKMCDMDESSRLLIKTPIVWAVCEYELFSAFIVGGTAVVDHSCQRNVGSFKETLVEHKVSVTVTSAPVLQLLAEELVGSAHSLRHVVNVGGAMPMQVCAEALKSMGAEVQIHNMYGCTETPCTQWTYGIERSSELPACPKMCPAGRPQPGVEVHVLDEHLQPVPHGATGEVCFGGPFLSRGYFGDAAETQKRFCENPSCKGRIYRSGDIGCWVPDPAAPSKKVLQITGRKDRQFNINGVRVSPEEVEGRLAGAPTVQEACVVQAGAGDSGIIVACVACTAPGARAEEALLAYCQNTFTKAMCPEKVIARKTLPKLANGKVDTKKVEAFAQEAHVTKAVDSLGLMRSLLPSQMKAKHIADNVCAVSVMAMVSFHTWQTGGDKFLVNWGIHKMSGSCYNQAWLRALAIDWRETSEWSSFGFAFAGAYLDAQSPDRFTFGLRECVILWSYLAACLVHFPLAPQWGGVSMWYLPMLLAAKVILVLLHKARLPVELQSVIFMMVPFACVLCPDIEAMEARFGNGNANLFGLYAMFTQTKLKWLAVYGLTFLLAPDLMRPAISHAHSLSRGVSVVMSILYSMCFLLLVYASGIIGYPETTGFFTRCWNCMCDSIIFAPLLGACIHLPAAVHFRWISQNALGSYVSSCVFYDTYAWKHQDVLWRGLSSGLGGGNIGAAAQLLAVALFTILWVCIVGPAAQWLLLAPVKVCWNAAAQSSRGSKAA